MGAELSSHLAELLARGEVIFSSQEAEQSLGIVHGAQMRLYYPSTAGWSMLVSERSNLFKIRYITIK